MHAASKSPCCVCPGHGTLPSMMTEMSLNDWNAAVRIAARDVAKRTPAGQPFYLAGHSTGGTLALQYALDALDDKSLRMPDRLLLMSPAINITKVAVVAGFIDFMSVVPVPVLEKVRWIDVMPEFDPYKFNSFTVNATRQVNRSARALRRSLADAMESGRIADLPPVITWQSVVDSTVGTAGAVDVLYSTLKGAQAPLGVVRCQPHPRVRQRAEAAGTGLDRAPAAYATRLHLGYSRQCRCAKRECPRHPSDSRIMRRRFLIPDCSGRVMWCRSAMSPCRSRPMIRSMASCPAAAMTAFPASAPCCCAARTAPSAFRSVR